MDIDHSMTATIMITVEEFLGRRWIVLTTVGRAAMIGVTQPIIHIIDCFQKII